jgi:hypothetical protein
MFVAVCVIAGVGSSVLRHRETQKTIRQVIESGQALDPQLLDRILKSSRAQPGGSPRQGLMFGGIMMLSIGAGLAVIGWSMSRINPSQLYPGLGVAALVGLIGVGLLVAGAVIHDPRDDRPE